MTHVEERTENRLTVIFSVSASFYFICFEVALE